ncbi:MAG: SPOR domain-containing protein [Gammaproteobacteria bacterium]|nr:SPOR domain-containing protein [Gammaproteobacteria bacterium]
MARDYKNANKRSTTAERPPGSWASFFTGLAIGLVVAVLAYYWGGFAQPRATATRTNSNAAPVNDVPQPTTPEAPTSGQGSQTIGVPAPKFDFYKILPEIEVKVPESEPATAPTNEAIAGAAKPTGAYMLQVGSFQRFEEADQAKAQLALQGVHASIQRVVINGQDAWYRVHIGPYAALPAAQAMRSRLTQLGMSSIMLRLGGNEPP